ncbi:MAG: M1 family metallopeptidase [Gemmatimonadaceae bacterium]
MTSRCISYQAQRLVAAACLTLCLPAAAVAQSPAATAARWPARPVQRTIPLGPNIERAYRAGTRDSTGSPGAHYWQQSVDYAIDARLDVDSAVLHGTERITLHNTSPDTLHTIVLRLLQNYFTAGESRDDYVTDITQGDVLEHLTVNGEVIPLGDPRVFRVDGTVAVAEPHTPALPGATAVIDAAWHFAVPNVPLDQRAERMGRWGTSLYQVAQWYPQVAMYDDMRGWDIDKYLGLGEFYNQFGNFDVKITVPAGWLVGATGTLDNPSDVLSATTRDRLSLAMHADTTVHVVDAQGRGAGTATAAGTALTWHFTAPRVNDFAFATSKNYVWDATHADTPSPTLVQVFYWPEHTDYHQSAQFARFALEHHSKMIMPYSFPQASVADGPEMGMEYPMIVFCSPDLSTITHELGHEWFPMTVSSDETRYGWQDEGFNDYIDLFSDAAYAKHPVNFGEWIEAYRELAGQDLEPTLMWPSDYAGPGYEEQAYAKAPVALRALGGVVGDSAVKNAFAAYAHAWAYKHPSPWDFFMFMDHQLGQDLGWFWNAWWFTRDTFDQAISSVRDTKGQLEIHVSDHGTMAMPMIARITWSNGSTQTVVRPASVWFAGDTTLTITVPTQGKTVRSVRLDPENRFQDMKPADNTWKQGSGA